jgi:pimeloyl-ACP methyl ester carboxylesterase
MPYVTSGGCRIFYEVIDLVSPWVAEPETLVLHHGLGSGRESWAEWLPALIDRCRVVRFDMRGHHLSKDGAETEQLSFDLLTRDVLAVAEAGGVDRFHFAGESVGGTIGLALALDHAERLLSLTVSNAAHRGESVRAIGHFNELIDTRGVDAWSENMMPGRFAPGAIGVETWDWYRKQQGEISPAIVKGVVASLMGMDLTDSLPRIGTRTLLLQGDSSPFIEVDVTLELARGIRGAQLQVFAGARHGLPVSHARPAAALLRKFILDGQATGGQTREGL